MNELIEKVENLKLVLDESKEVKDIKKINKEIMKDKKLLSLIEKYNTTFDEKIKEEIINHPLFRDYKEKETDLNILILSINKKLKELNSKGKCVK